MLVCMRAKNEAVIGRIPPADSRLKTRNQVVGSELHACRSISVMATHEKIAVVYHSSTLQLDRYA